MHMIYTSFTDLQAAPACHVPCYAQTLVYSLWPVSGA